MSYTIPNGAPQGVSKTESNFLRETLVGEIIAINDYSQHIILCPISEISKTLTHIMEEEKHHYGTLMELIRKNDPIQMEQYLHVMEDHHHSRRRSSKKYRSSYEAEKLHMVSLLNFIRHDVKGELEAIISYEDILSKIRTNSVAKVVESIIKDEKEHVEELTNILMKYDKHSYDPMT